MELLLLGVALISPYVKAYIMIRVIEKLVLSRKVVGDYIIPTADFRDSEFFSNPTLLDIDGGIYAFTEAEMLLAEENPEGFVKRMEEVKRTPSRRCMKIG